MKRLSSRRVMPRFSDSAHFAPGPRGRRQPYHAEYHPENCTQSATVLRCARDDARRMTLAAGLVGRARPTPARCEFSADFRSDSIRQNGFQRVLAEPLGCGEQLDERQGALRRMMA